MSPHSQLTRRIILQKQLCSRSAMKLFKVMYRRQALYYPGVLDLSAAFDTVDHKVFIHKLYNEFGIGDEALNWFRSCLDGMVWYGNCLFDKYKRHSDKNCE